MFFGRKNYRNFIYGLTTVTILSSLLCTLPVNAADRVIFGDGETHGEEHAFRVSATTAGNSGLREVIHANDDRVAETFNVVRRIVPTEAGTNAGTEEGYMPERVSYVVPTVSGVSEGMFNFAIDPHELLSSNVSSGMSVEKGATVLFHNADGGYSSQSDRLTICNRGAMPVEATVTIMLYDYTGIALTSDPNGGRGIENGLYLAIVDEDGNTYPIDSEGRASYVKEIEAVPEEAYNIVWDNRNEVYQAQLQEGWDDFDVMSFGIVGRCNPNGVWAAVDGEVKISVVWSVKTVEGESYIIYRSDDELAEEITVSNEASEEFIGQENATEDISTENVLVEAADREGNLPEDILVNTGTTNIETTNTETANAEISMETESEEASEEDLLLENANRENVMEYILAGYNMVLTNSSAKENKTESTEMQSNTNATAGSDDALSEDDVTDNEIVEDNSSDNNIEETESEDVVLDNSATESEGSDNAAVEDTDIVIEETETEDSVTENTVTEDEGEGNTVIEDNTSDNIIEETETEDVDTENIIIENEEADDTFIENTISDNVIEEIEAENTVSENDVTDVETEDNGVTEDQENEEDDLISSLGYSQLDEEMARNELAVYYDVDPLAVQVYGGGLPIDLIDESERELYIRMNENGIQENAVSENSAGENMTDKADNGMYVTEENIGENMLGEANGDESGVGENDANVNVVNENDVNEMLGDMNGIGETDDSMNAVGEAAVNEMFEDANWIGAIGDSMNVPGEAVVNETVGGTNGVGAIGNSMNVPGEAVVNETIGVANEIGGIENSANVVEEVLDDETVGVVSGVGTNGIFADAAGRSAVNEDTVPERVIVENKTNGNGIGVNLEGEARDDIFISLKEYRKNKDHERANLVRRRSGGGDRFIDYH